MKVTEIQFIPTKPNNGFMGVASCVLNDSYYIGSIAVYTKLGGGHRLLFPTKRIGDRQLPIHHPITKEAGAAITQAILRHVEEVFHAPASASIDSDGEITPASATGAI